MPYYRTVTPTSMQNALDTVSGGSAKGVKNNTGVTIAADRALAWLDGGTVALASANSISITDFAGFSTAAILNGQYGTAKKGGNIPGILTGMGAVPGQLVYLGSTPGTVSLTPPSATGTTVLKLGRAEPPDNNSAAGAIDLFIELEVIAEN